MSGQEIQLGIKITAESKEAVGAIKDVQAAQQSLSQEMVGMNGKAGQQTLSLDQIAAGNKRAAEASRAYAASMAATSADVSKLLDKYDPLSAKLKQLQGDFTALDKAVASGQLSGKDTNRVDSVYAQLQASIAATKGEIAGLGNVSGATGKAMATGMEAAAAGADKAMFATAGAKREVMVLAHELMQGNFSKIPGSLMVLGERINITAEKLGGWGTIIGTVGAAFVAFEAAKHFTGMVTETIKTQDELGKLSYQTGVTVEELSALQNTAAQSGTPFSVVTSSLEHLSKTMNDASNGGAKTTEAFRSFGISAKDVAANLDDPAKMLQLLADRSELYAPSANKNAALMELTGMKAQKAALMMHEMAEQGMGVVTMTTAQSESAIKYHAALEQWKRRNDELKNQIAGELTPVMTDLVKAFTAANKKTDDAVSAAQKLREDHNLKAWATDAGYAVAGIADIVADATYGFKVLGLGAASSALLVKSAFTATYLAFAPGMDVAQRKTALGLLADDVTAAMAQLKTAMEPKSSSTAYWDAFSARLQKTEQQIAYEADVELTTTEGKNKLLNTYNNKAKADKAASETAYINAVAALRKSEAALSYTIQETADKDQLALLEYQHKALLVSDADYYDQKLNLDTDAAQAKVREIEAQIQAETAARDKLAPSSAAYQKDTQNIIDLAGKLVAAYSKLQNVGLADYYTRIGEAAKTAAAGQKTLEALGVAEIDTLNKSIAAQQLHNAEIGKSAEQKLLEKKAIEDAGTAQMQVDEQNLRSAAQSQELDANQRDILTLRANQLDDEIAKRQKLAALIEQGAALNRQFEEVKKQAEGWKSVESAAHAAWGNIEKDGIGSLKRLGDTLKSAIWDMLYQMTVKQWVVSIAASVSGSGVAQQAFGATGASGALGATSWLNAGSTANSAYNLYSGGISGAYQNAAMSSAGQWLGLSQSTGATAATLGANGSLVGGYSGGASMVGEYGGYTAIPEAGGAGLTAVGEAGAAAAESLSSLIPVIGWLYAGYKAINYFDSKEGSTKTITGASSTTGRPSSSDYSPAVTAPIEGDFFSELLARNQQQQVDLNTAMATSLDGLQASYVRLATQLGASSPSSAMSLSYTSDPGGTSPTDYRVSVAGGGQSWSAQTAEGRGDPTPVLARLMPQMLLEAIKQTDLGPVGNALVAGIDPTTMTQEMVTAELNSLSALTPQMISGFEKTFGKAFDVTKISALSANGENLIQTFERLSAEFSITDQVGALLGHDTSAAFGSVGAASAGAREQLISLMGGVAAMTTTLQGYYTFTRTASEQAANSTKTVAAEFSAIGFSMPSSAAAFKSLVESQDLTTASGRTAAAALLNLSGDLAKVVPSADAAAQAAEALAKTNLGVQQQIAVASGAQTQQEVERANQLAGATDATTAALYQQLYAQQDVAAATTAATQAAAAATAAATALANTNQGILDQIAVSSGAKTQQEVDRANQLAGATDVTTAALYQQLYAQQDVAAATTASTQAAAQAVADALALARADQGIQDQIDVLTGAKTQQQIDRAAQLSGATDATTAALYQQLYAQQDLKFGADAVAKTYQDSSAAAIKYAKGVLAAQKEAHDLALQSANDAVATATTAANTAAQDVQTAQSTLSSARSALISSYQSEATALQATIDKFKGFSQSLVDFRDALMSGDQSPLDQSQRYDSSAQQLDKVYALALSGDSGAVQKFSAIGSQFLAQSKEGSIDAAAYARDVARVQAMAGAISNTSRNQAAIAQSQMDDLRAQVSGLVDINESVLSVRDAIIALQSAMAGASAASQISQSADQSLTTATAAQKTVADQPSAATEQWVKHPDGSQTWASSAGAYGYVGPGAEGGMLYGKNGQVGTFEYIYSEVSKMIDAGNQMGLYLAAQDWGISSVSLDAFMGWQNGASNTWAAANGLPGFAAGGGASAGYYMAGENGPELIHADVATRIYPAEQTSALMSRFSNPAVNIDALVSEIRELQRIVGLQSAQLSNIATSSAKTAEVLDNATAGGGPMLVEIA